MPQKYQISTISNFYCCRILAIGDIPLDTNTCANYMFPSFILHKRVRIFKLIRKRSFKTHFESSLSYCKFIFNSSLNKLATFQLLWDTFIEITPALVSRPPFSFRMDDIYKKKEVESTDVYRWRRRNFCILMVSYQRYGRFV